MSLSDKWEKFRSEESVRWTPSQWNGILNSLQRAFYAGAEAGMNRQSPMSMFIEFDRFREFVAEPAPPAKEKSHD